MTKWWLVLDMNYLCWRAHHAIRNLSTTKALRTEVLYGVLRDIVLFQDLHNTKRIVFAFDHGRNVRLDIFPAYKDRPPIDEFVRKTVKEQIRLLRKEVLYEIGFKNVFYKTGYEADDVIASVCQNLPSKSKAIIIASDQDFYQLLNKNVMIWNPATKEPMTEKSFRKQHLVEPAQWAMVKAIAGCHSDKVPGVRGVGEVTALRFLRGELPNTANSRLDILHSGAMIERNLKLVKLPFPGVGTFKLREDRINRERWNSVMLNFELRSLENKREERKEKAKKKSR